MVPVTDEADAVAFCEVSVLASVGTVNVYLACPLEDTCTVERIFLPLANLTVTATVPFGALVTVTVCFAPGFTLLCPTETLGRAPCRVSTFIDVVRSTVMLR